MDRRTPNRRTVLRASASSVAFATAGCMFLANPGTIQLTGGVGTLHRADETFLEGGVTADDGGPFAAVLVGTPEGTDRVTAPPDDPIAARVAETDFASEFLLVLEALAPAEDAVSLALVAGTEELTGWRRMRVDARVEPWDTPIPEELAGADELVYTAVYTLERQSVPPPGRARVDLYATDGTLRTTLRTESPVRDA